MLIDKQTIAVQGDIVTIKLISGEEIIGRLTEQGIDTVTLAKPVSLQPVSPNQMGLAPVLQTVDRDASLQILKSAMAVRPVKTSKAIASNYIEMTSGLITPSGTGNLAL